MTGRFEDRLRLLGRQAREARRIQGLRTDVASDGLFAEDCDRMADLVAAVRALRDAPRDGTVDIAALHRRQEAALAALDEEGGHG